MQSMLVGSFDRAVQRKVGRHGEGIEPEQPVGPVALFLRRAGDHLSHGVERDLRAILAAGRDRG
ncbi:hypothetical protein E6C67_11335 [Azospirillum sp. TSA2s]|jgi:hypothetical protein|uniref:hypothetical protein n=1 Tax=Azospirillum sp. TSA2s TaxID=709810 RepID=UPI0010A9E38D|nr:hypothetical protein [Azospirillum sp. TSA2s]QCG94508.1 hypothetical protein E6C67_11335 [Azospirillum sp. TSA2s]